MGRPKGGKNKSWSKEEKLRTIRRYFDERIGQDTLAKFAALSTSKSLTEEERLKLIVEKQKIEIERLKKGYVVKGVGASKEFVTLRDLNTK